MARLLSEGGAPASVVEPTVGVGAFLVAASRAFPAAKLVGLDVDATHLDECRRVLPQAELEEADVFAFEFDALAARLPEPVLLIGNPPWVTSSAMPRLGGSNLPQKTRVEGTSGLEARTGKANFDVAEWILVRLLRAFEGKRFRGAFLIKTQVARRLMERAERERLPLGTARIVQVDARAAFGAAVDACLFVFDGSTGGAAIDAEVFDSMDASEPSRRIGLRDGMLVSNLEAYDRARPYLGFAEPCFRSGVKHDCATVLELEVRDGGMWNGLGEPVDVEPEVLHPLVKGGDLEAASPRQRMLLLPQTSLGESEEALAHRAPRAHAYLSAHAEKFARRGSSIYRGRPRFAVFGLGPYSFAPYKVAIFGLGKKPRFHLLSPRDGRVVMLDDTAYFMPFDDEEHAREALGLLESPRARDVIEAFFFRDAKRPITKGLLMRLELAKLRG